MRIGLVRHYKVNKSFPRKFLVSLPEVIEWFEDYENAEIIKTNTDSSSSDWDICYCSPTKRTTETALSIYRGETIIAEELRELNVLRSMDSKLKLPFLIWGLLIRKKSLSANKATSTFSQKICSFVDRLLATDEKNVLVVSHGFVMLYLQNELKKRHFRGDYFRTPLNGKVYEFKRNDKS